MTPQEIAAVRDTWDAMVESGCVPFFLVSRDPDRYAQVLGIQEFEDGEPCLWLGGEARFALAGLPRFSLVWMEPA